MKNYFYLLTFLLALCTAPLFSQNAILSIQGTVQNSSGAAVEDGTYSLTFKLYTAASGGMAIWTETQPSIAIQSGVYSVELGTVTPLNVPFDVPYFLGVSVDGGTEMAPRARLTAAPYALSLRGQDNIFSSTGKVGIGTTSPSEQLHVKSTGNVLSKVEGTGISAIEVRDNSTSSTLRMGYYGSSKIKLENDNGAIDIKATGNTDVYHGATKRLSVESTGVNINGNAQLANDGDIKLGTNGDVELGTGGNIKYGTNNDWRLVDIDDFSTGNDGWACQEHWNDSTAEGIHRIQPNTPFSKGWLIGPDNTADADDVIWKQFDLSAHPHSLVKVVFTMHLAGTWDDNEVCWAAFSTEQASTATGANNNGKFQFGWTIRPNEELHHTWYNRTGYIPTTGNEALDFNRRGEMVAQTDLTSFYILFGGGGNESTSTERFYISDVEIWVK